MPMVNAFGQKVDSGAFLETFDRALAEADADGFAERRRTSDAQARLRGLGFAYHIKGTGGSPDENVDIRFEADGTVSLTIGTHSVGQGHATTFLQILADRLGLPNEHIRVCRLNRRASTFQRARHGKQRSAATNDVKRGDGRERRLRRR